MVKHNKKIVVVALSGGVDSSLAALLLKKQGYEVMGVHIKMWSDPDIPCTLKEDRHDAMRVAAQLNIPFQTWDCTKEYRQAIVGYMIKEYAAGRTPNPDVMCNQKIKFGIFLKKALKIGADYVATGHYAQLKKKGNKYQLLAGQDKNKDQSYFLWSLNQKQLKYIIFPIGGYLKPAVRKLALKFALPTAQKKDSQGLCFMGKIDLPKFLKKYIPVTPGKILTTQGQVIGEHQGLSFHTIGQRHGLGVGGGTPYYVAKKDFKINTLIVAEGPKDKQLFSQELAAKNLNWILDQKPNFPLKCQARIRYRQPLQKCQIDFKNRKSKYLKVVFNQPQWAVASGQSIVFYQKDQVLGGGVIK